MTPPCENEAHCWHTRERQPGDSELGYYGPAHLTPQVCCNCGKFEMRDLRPPIPPGHGPFYPRPKEYPRIKPMWTTGKGKASVS